MNPLTRAENEAWDELQAAAKKLRLAQEAKKSSPKPKKEATVSPKVGFVALSKLSEVLGLPSDWLSAEASAGRLPHLIVGREMMFRIPDVEASLVEQTKIFQAAAQKKQEVDNG